jgi:hypothetical protein
VDKADRGVPILLDFGIGRSRAAVMHDAGPGQRIQDPEGFCPRGTLFKLRSNFI